MTMESSSSSHIQLKYELQNLVKFIPYKGNAQEDFRTRASPGLSGSEVGLSGNEARTFYEHLLSAPETEPKYLNSKPKQIAKAADRQKSQNPSDRKERDDNNIIHSDQRSCTGFNKSDRSVNRLLLCAQNGELRNVKKCVSAGTHLNSRDEFGWTALMCAAYAGHDNVVEHLLSLGANKDICDSQGRTAISLSKKQGHEKILDILEKSQQCRQGNSSKNRREMKPFYCDVCRSDFTTPQVEHCLSVVHQFSLKKTKKSDPFVIPLSNRGYQLMKKSGWDGESGLGPDGQGQKYPVKTVLKRDRKCLGTGKSQDAKVTHFKSNDAQAVEKFQKPLQRIMSVRTMSRKARLAKERKNKQWEKNMRLYFNTE